MTVLCVPLGVPLGVRPGQSLDLGPFLKIEIVSLFIPHSCCNLVLLHNNWGGWAAWK